jgi:hypothetical protein
VKRKLERRCAAAHYDAMKVFTPDGFSCSVEFGGAKKSGLGHVNNALTRWTGQGQVNQATIKKAQTPIVRSRFVNRMNARGVPNGA